MDSIANRYCKYGRGEDFYFLDFNEPVNAISSAPFNGGFKKIERYINRQVPLDYNHDPVEEIGSFLDERGFPMEKSLITITACDIGKAVPEILCIIMHFFLAVISILNNYMIYDLSVHRYL